MTRVAIIGAGLAGLTLARQLATTTHVSVFEKARGVSGRMATRRLGDFEFDHGAQFITARSKLFKQFLAPFIASGEVAKWTPRVLTLAPGKKPYKRDWFEPHYVPVPTMTSLCKALGNDLDIHLQTPVSRLRKIQSGAGPLWFLETGSGVQYEPFDWVISTAPQPQTRALFADHCDWNKGADSGTDIGQVAMSANYTLMLGLADLPDPGFDAARVKNLGIEWITVSSSRPGRNDLPGLVIQSNNQWAQEHLEVDDTRIIELMLADLETALGQPLPEIRQMALQRWRHAKVEQPLDADCLLDQDQHLAACGDWCLGQRLENAFLSACSLGQRVAPLI